MEKQAMKFFNVLGNKFFAVMFSFVLGQRFKDTLCGTKVLTRANYFVNSPPIEITLDNSILLATST